MDLEGAILAGGRSRRMGRDKSILRLGRRTMIERIAEAMDPLVSRVRVIVATDAPGRHLYPVQPDLRPGLGPLSGIHAALATARSPAVVVVACDLPFVTTALLQALVKILSEREEVAVPRVGERAIPVCGLYRVSCLPFLETRLDRGALKARDFLAEVSTAFLEGEALARVDPGGRSLKNINTPEEYEEALSIVNRESSGSSITKP